MLVRYDLLAVGSSSDLRRCYRADHQRLVTDTSGGVLPGVTVQATNTATRQVRTATTDESGRYAEPATCF